MRKGKNNVRMAVLYAALFVVSLVLIAVFIPQFIGLNFSNDDNTEYYQSPFCVSFVDVGQGDCTLLSCNGVNILVDGGEAEYAGTVLSYLKSVEVDKIDCYILSHPHSDHIGAGAEIINSIPIDKVFVTHFSEFNIPTTNTYENILDAIASSSAELVEVAAGDNFTFGDLKLNIVAPYEESDDYNDMSIVFTATYKDTSILLTGDTTKKVEKQILSSGADIDCDILKIAHHGSSTSSAAEFIDAVSPELSVISCGENNSYSHPHNEILELFANRGLKYMRTDEMGTIVYYGDGKVMKAEALG